MDTSILTVIGLVALIFSLIALGFGSVALILMLALKHSTHTTQLVPMDSRQTLKAFSGLGDIDAEVPSLEAQDYEEDEPEDLLASIKEEVRKSFS